MPTPLCTTPFTGRPPSVYSSPMHTPKVSIGIPVYNGEKYLSETLRSLLEQDYTDFELIISDNASTDDTEKIGRAASADRRVRYYRNPVNIGVGPNFERVFALAKGEFFKWACVDDMHYPGYLRRTVEVLSAAPREVVLVTPRVSLIDEEGRSLLDEKGLPLPRAGIAPGYTGPERISTHAKTPHERLAEVLPRLQWSTAQFGLFRRDTLALTRRIESFYYSDRALLAEVAMLGEIWEIDEPLFAFRRHAEASTLRNKTDKEYHSWMNAGAKAKRRRTMSLEYIRSIRRLPLSSSERALCLAVVMRVWLSNFLKKIKKSCLSPSSSVPTTPGPTT
jgi:glycosyltransferase involved in cell wall biosynthesis